MRLFRLILVLLMIAAIPAFADSVQVGATATGTAWDSWISSLHSTAQQFTLTSATKVTSIWLGISSSELSDHTYGLTITDALTGGTTYWSIHDYVASPTYNPTDLVLQPGTYYLVAQADSWGTAGAWYFTNTGTAALKQDGGTVGSWWVKSSGGNWVTSSYYYYNFEIDGTTSIPEPGTFALLGIGLVAIRVRRSRK